MIVSAEERTTFGDAETFYTASDDEKVRHNDQMILLQTFRELVVSESTRLLIRGVTYGGCQRSISVEDVSRKLKLPVADGVTLSINRFSSNLCKKSQR